MVGALRYLRAISGVRRVWARVTLALWLTVLCCAALVAPPLASADVIAPGQRPVGYCAEVANLAAYPDDVVLLLGVEPSLGPYAIVRPGDCVGFYKLSTGVLYAVRKDAFDPAAVPAEAAKQAAYFDAQPQFRRAPLRLHPLTTVDERDSRTAVADIVEIGALTDRGFDARLARVRYTYTDGTSEELALAADGSRPAPRAVADSRAARLRAFALAWCLVVSGLALVGLVALLLLRRRRR